MNDREEKRKASDAKIVADIAKYGCHVIGVFDPEGELPTFNYSIGIQETTGAPEAIVIGLDPKLGHSVINTYHRRVRDGEVFARGTPVEGFLQGFPVLIEPAKKVLVAEYSFACARHYGRKPFRTVQIVYPTTRGAWPWEAAASDSFRKGQPMLGRKRPDRP